MAFPENLYYICGELTFKTINHQQSIIGMIINLFLIIPFFKIKNQLVMEITNVLTETVKDVVAISKSVAKVVKDEVELYFDKKNEDNDEVVEGNAAESEDSRSLFEYLREFESKVKEVVDNTFSGFRSSKREEQEELETRISALEEKLSKLVEDSLDVLNKDKTSKN